MAKMALMGILTLHPEHRDAFLAEMEDHKAKTLAGEPGTSLRAAGWRRAGETKGGSWDRPARRRVSTGNTGPKVRWEVDCA